MTKKFFVTTPIYYVNDVPHIGHTCTTVVADIIARYHKLLGEEVFFLTGTDEHGAKVAEEAKKAGLSPQDFCDKVSQTFAAIWPKLNIQFDYFIRTTNPGHEKIVQELIQKIYDRGDIYKAKYEGLYCVGCERFYTEADLVDGKCPLHPNKEIQKQSEENYFFKLSKYVPVLIKAIEDPHDPNHYLISPAAKKEEVLSKLKAGVGDLSISRANVAWGIPIPWDKSQTIYVWFDALINYYSALKITGKEDFWPADLHLIGKEILWFHAVIWEAMLIAAKIPVPKEVFAHDFYMIDGQKMSKSLGNVIAPQQLIDKFGPEATRYLIASSFPYDKDSDVGLQRFTEKYNADLANGLGNLTSRILAMLQKYSNGTIPSVNLEETGKYVISENRPAAKFSKTGSPRSEVSLCWDDFVFNLNRYSLERTLQSLNRLISYADSYIAIYQPWTKPSNLNIILYDLAEILGHLSFLISPFLPESSLKIKGCLGIDPAIKPINPEIIDFETKQNENYLILDWGEVVKPGEKIKLSPPIFPRI